MTKQHSGKIDKTTLPFGNWPSVISAELIVSESISIDEPKITDNFIYHIERRPNEGGRCVIVKTQNQKTFDLLPAPYSARSRVHEYGGGCYCLDNNVTENKNPNSNNIIYFVNDKDQDIYCLKNNNVNRITNTDNKRFADLIFDKIHGRLIAVCETHNHNTAKNIEIISNSIVSISIRSGDISTLIEGNDFFASPRLNSTSKKICWQTWNHPNMPWDGNQLWISDIDESGETCNPKLVAGGDTISTFQPQWSPDDILYYISDDTSWWHLYRFNENESHDLRNQQLTEGEKEFGLPQWVFAQSTYSFINSSTIICSFQSQGKTFLATLSLTSEATLNNPLNIIETEWQEFNSLVSSSSSNQFCFIAASDKKFPELISATLNDDIDDEGTINPSSVSISTELIKSSCKFPISDDYYSKPQIISFNNRYNKLVYANYYPPTNPEFEADNSSPPLIVICHGGPTGQSSTALDPKKQFWTSRGFALLDVNYSGSTGYGRDYRLRLNGKWGQLDVEDCCDAALHAVKKNLADENCLIIRGSSAGGFTVLSALTFQNVFSVGASYYGISELTSLATDTHKFEARYLDRLIGPYPEAKQLYKERSPINHTDQLNCPVIFFQGIEDKVVPKDQAEKMFTALNDKNVSVAAQFFENEQHGFRQANTITSALENELNFYQLIFNLKPKDKIKFVGDILLKNM